MPGVKIFHNLNERIKRRNSNPPLGQRETIILVVFSYIPSIDVLTHRHTVFNQSNK